MSTERRSESACVISTPSSSSGVLSRSSGCVSGVGMWGHSYYEHLPWRDAFLNAAMLLGGMGPVKVDLSEPGKVFAGLFALYSGLVVIAVTALLLAPGIHHIMKRVHWEDRSDTE